MLHTLDYSLELHRLFVAKHRFFMVQFAGTQIFYGTIWIFCTHYIAET